MLASKASESYSALLSCFAVHESFYHSTASQTVFSKMPSWCRYLVGTLCVEERYEAT